MPRSARLKLANPPTWHVLRAGLTDLLQALPNHVDDSLLLGSTLHNRALIAIGVVPGASGNDVVLEVMGLHLLNVSGSGSFNALSSEKIELFFVHDVMRMNCCLRAV